MTGAVSKMATRRKFVASLAGSAAASNILGRSGVTTAAGTTGGITIKPYKWEGPYAEYRNNGALHDWRLCAEVKAPWPGPCERIILRTCEVVGYETGFLYDDHFPPSEPNGRGKDYHHIPFEWKVEEPHAALSADCPVPGKGKFWLRLRAQRDYVDIHLGVRNEMAAPMGTIDWAFCCVGLESPSIADSNHDRTFLFDGERLRALADMGGRNMELYAVAGSHRFVPAGHRGIPVSSIEARASLVIVEGVGKKNSVALGFEQSGSIYGDAIGNKCFHADPFFGALTKTGEERTVRGKLYFLNGNAQQAWERYRRDFAGRA
jgi:hypothetical protein